MLSKDESNAVARMLRHAVVKDIIYGWIQFMPLYTNHGAVYRERTWTINPGNGFPTATYTDEEVLDYCAMLEIAGINSDGLQQHTRSHTQDPRSDSMG